MWACGGPDGRGRISSARSGPPSHWFSLASHGGSPLTRLQQLCNPVTIILAILALFVAPITSDKGPGGLILRCHRRFKSAPQKWLLRVFEFFSNGPLAADVNLNLCLDVEHYFLKSGTQYFFWNRMLDFINKRFHILINK